MKKLDFAFFDAGGGHRSAANALREAIEHKGFPWQIRLVHLQQELDSIDVFRRLTGMRLEDIYNRMLNKGWTLGSPQLTRIMQMVIRVFHPAQVRLLEQFWRQDPPDMVVSVVPNLNRAVGEALRRVNPATPLVTILTDIADYPPHFWIERQPQAFICGSDRAVEQVRRFGHPDARAYRVSGMILNPRFYEPQAIDRDAERRRLGLDPSLPTGLVLFGGQGSEVMYQIARRMDTQLILICGRNEKLAARLRELRRSRPAFVEGFTREVPYYMKLADFFIGKPGPGSLSEALHSRLPVIVERNAWTLPQERYNTEWVVENGYGLVLPDFRGIGAAAADMLEPARFEAFKASVEQYRNNAVWEIPDILRRILDSV